MIPANFCITARLPHWSAVEFAYRVEGKIAAPGLVWSTRGEPVGPTSDLIELELRLRPAVTHYTINADGPEPLAPRLSIDKLMRILRDRGNRAEQAR